MRLICFAAVAILAAGGDAAAAAIERPALRPWRPQDSIALRTFDQDQRQPGYWPQPGRDETFVASPDQRYFFFLTHHGELSSDAVIYELQVFDTAAVKAALATAARSGPIEPHRRVTFRSYSSIDPGIKAAQWLGDSSAVVFQGMTAAGTLQLHRLDMRGGGREALTQLTDHPREIVYFNHSSHGFLFQDRTESPASPVGYPMEAAARADDGSVMSPEERASLQMRGTLHVSPWGGSVAAMLDLDAVVTDALWTSDGAGVIVVTRRAILACDVASKACKEQGGDAARAVASPRVSGKREAALRGASLSLAGLTVELQQAANDPPAVVAKYGKHTAALTAADPALEGIWRSAWQPFHWSEPDGRTYEGALLLPREFSLQQPVPLVVQAFSYRHGGDYSRFFLPDGMHHGSSDAAQSLAARGFAVLWIDAWNPGPVNPLTEGPDFVRKIDAVVDALAARRMIDRQRVGVTGFSRGGYATYYAITHPARTQLAAVVCDDSNDGSYVRYLIGGADMPPLSDDVAAHVGASFWKDRAAWLQHETTFNVDRVRTPALFTRKNSSFAPYSWNSLQTIGAFRLNGRPLEYLFFPTGNHQLHRPRERLALSEAVVEWMSFWLQDQQPADPERAERWRTLRDLQRDVMKAPVP